MYKETTSFIPDDVKGWWRRILFGIIIYVVLGLLWSVTMAERLIDKFKKVH